MNAPQAGKRAEKTGRLQADVTLDLVQERRLPALNFQVVGVERGFGEMRVGFDFLVSGDVFRTQLEILASARIFSETVDCKTQVRQYFVIHDVIEEYGVRIECILLKNHAIVEYSVVANDSLPVIIYCLVTLRSGAT